MKIEEVYKDSFVVIGKEGSTQDGDGFIQRLWQRPIPILMRLPTLQKGTNQETSLAYGGQ